MSERAKERDKRREREVEEEERKRASVCATFFKKSRYFRCFCF